MLKKRVEYKNFLGNPMVKDLYFHISATDAQRMMMRETTFVTDESGEIDKDKIREGLSARISATMNRGIGKEILELFDWLVENAYGIIGDDGESFEKSSEVYKAWTKTASYDAFFTNLLQDTDAMTEFVNGIFPEELRKRGEESKLDPEFAAHRAALASRGIPTV